MINDMPYHVKAWYKILNDLGATISMERMKEECYGKNQELLERIFPGRFSEEEKNKMSLEKEKQYQHNFKPHLQLLPGLKEFLQLGDDAGIKMAIGSAAILFNIDFVLDNLGIRKYFDALISADDVQQSKPDPETYLKCAKKLNIEPGNCLVFEDAPKGVESAFNAGMKTYVITLMHEKKEFNGYSNIIGFSKNFENIKLQSLLS